MTDLNLETNFLDASRDDWHALAKKGLRGADFDTLVSRTEDGLRRGPLFDAGDRPDSSAALPRGDAPLLEGRPWHICAPVMDGDDAFANRQLLADLLGGASAVRIMRGGVSRTADLKRLLEGVHIDLVPIVVDPSVASDVALFLLGTDDFDSSPVTLGLDPLGERPIPHAEWRAFTVDAARIHEQGGTDAQALAVFAATTAEAFRRHGPGVADDLSALFALGTDAHLGIVKLRAARRLYAEIASAFEVETPDLPVHAVSSLRMMHGADAWTNMLRTMSAGFGAVAGGADYITLRPFTELPEERRMGDATPFGYRIARNQQLLMMEESHLGQVRDVAYGSYFHESLTESLAHESWSLFQSIETAGGIETFTEKGNLDAMLAEAHADREARGEPVLGVTLHPDPDLRKPEVR